MPNTRPETVFDDQGVCDAYRSAERKHKTIDWGKRDKEMREIIDCYRGDGSWYDCIIPVSGGKNSCFQAYIMKERFGMTPLCVNAIPCEMTEVGQKNLAFLRELGFDLMQLGMNRKVFREMVRIGFLN